jgi:hypothetical protein
MLASPKSSGTLCTVQRVPYVIPGTRVPVIYRTGTCKSRKILLAQYVLVYRDLVGLLYRRTGEKSPSTVAVDSEMEKLPFVPPTARPLLLSPLPEVV